MMFIRRSVILAEQKGGTFQLLNCHAERIRFDVKNGRFNFCFNR